MKVGLCGLGERLKSVAGTMHQLIPDFDLVAYTDPSTDRADEMRAEGIRMACYEDLAAMLKNESLDLLMIGSPNHMHLEHIRQSLSGGVRVFVEKPVVTTVAETFELLNIIREYGVCDGMLVGMVLRYSPLYTDLKAVVESGQLGVLSSIEASEHIAPEHGAFFMRDWRRNVAHSGGFLLEKCVHDFDVYQSIIGARPMRVASFGGRKTFTSEHSQLESLDIYHQRKSRWGGTNTVFNDDVGLIDNQVALVEYANGTNLCFHTNLNVPDEYRHFCVVGARGMAEGDFVRNYLRVHDASSSEKLVDTSYDYDDGVSTHYGAEALMAKDWDAHFSTGTPLPVSILDALEAGLTAIKIDESRTTGKIIDMAEIWEQFDSYGLRARGSTPQQIGYQQ